MYEQVTGGQQRIQIEIGKITTVLTDSSDVDAAVNIVPKDSILPNQFEYWPFDGAFPWSTTDVIQSFNLSGFSVSSMSLLNGTELYVRFDHCRLTSLDEETVQEN